MVAEALALVAIGWFVPTIFAKVHELAASFASGIYKQYRGQQEKFERLADLLQSTKKGMEELAGSAGAAASSRSDNEVVWRFKDAVDDADDLLAALLKEDAADAKVMKGGRNYMGTLFGSSNPEPLTKLDRLLEDLKGIRDSLQQRLPQPQPRGGGSPARTSAAGQPAPPSYGLCGYSGQYTALRSGLLREGQGQHHQVVAVIGHGGTGKTALASWAFHRDEEVQANFDLLIWVDVHAKFRATDLLREMCKSAARSAHRSDVVVGERDDDVTSLKQKLKDILQHHQDDDDGGGGGKKKQKKKKQQRKKKKKTRYLLVLDDVCNDESAASEHSKSTAWATALDPFKQYGHSTSKILITTRPEICATRLGAAEPPIVLDGIDHNDMKLLIEKTTFGTTSPPDWWYSNRNARALSHNVAMLCGSPQLAEAFGKRLQGEIRSPADKMTRDREMRDIMRDEIPLVVCETHFSSYQSLPPHLQRCLALCSLFPNRWGFEKDKLVKMWVSLGFVVEDHPSETGKSEGRAGGYFDDLRKRGLFQKQKATGKVSGESRYEIYEHIHSMLRTMVCRNYFLSIDDGGGDGPKECDLFMARHLAVTTTKGSVEKLLKKLAMAKKLRTLIVFQHNGAAAAAAMLDEKMLKRLEGLRVMDLSYTTISEVPGTIGMLKQARYLGLPRTVGKMSSQVTKLSLVRYLDMPMEHIARIAGIGSLQMLQGSVEFHVLKTKDGHSMRELEELDSLRETLSIKGLEAVKTKEEAEGGHLERKRHLEVLKLEWGHRPELQRQAKVGRRRHRTRSSLQASSLITTSRSCTSRGTRGRRCLSGWQTAVVCRT
ncbi:hypothetical protein BS78_06G010300 [Paspalum vaginatum]|nr:hypothetical protein BS78_06G010300 [Paspalum vaginatum]